MTKHGFISFEQQENGLGKAKEHNISKFLRVEDKRQVTLVVF
jgi:hypothetical protein